MDQTHVRLKRDDLARVRVALVRAQKGYCPLCLKRWRGSVSMDQCVDHCHSTGHIRGVLCRNCNGMEGKLKTIASRAKRDGSIEGWLERVLAYYKQHTSQPLPYIHPDHKTEDEKRLLRNARARKKRAAAKRKK